MSAITKQTRSLSTQEISTNPLVTQQYAVLSIAKFLSVDDLGKARQVCQFWNAAISHAEPTLKRSSTSQFDCIFNPAAAPILERSNILQIEDLQKKIHKHTQLNQQHNITCVNLVGYTLPSDILKHLSESSQLHKLETLILRDCTYKYGEYGTASYFLFQMKTLTSLTISNSSKNSCFGIITNADFAQFCEELPKLRILSLTAQNTANLTDSCFSNLSKLPYLKELHLDVYAPNFRGDQIDVSPLPQLEVFGIRSPFSDKGLLTLCNICPNLTKLHILCPYTSITDEGLESLKKLSNLNTLELVSSATNKGLKSLGTLPKLKMLNLYAEKVTKEGIEQLPKGIALILNGNPIETTSTAISKEKEQPTPMSKKEQSTAVGKKKQPRKPNPPQTDPRKPNPPQTDTDTDTDTGSYHRNVMRGYRRIPVISVPLRSDILPDLILDTSRSDVVTPRPNSAKAEAIRSKLFALAQDKATLKVITPLPTKTAIPISELDKFLLRREFPQRAAINKEQSTAVGKKEQSIAVSKKQQSTAVGKKEQPRKQQTGALKWVAKGKK